jgi:hypothetical protein
MYLFLTEVERIAAQYAAENAAATVLVNHHDRATAERMARTALSEHGWLLRSVVRSRVLVGDEIRNAPVALAPFIKQATSDGVAFDIALLPKGLSPGDALVEPWLMRRIEGDVDAAPDYPA